MANYTIDINFNSAKEEDGYQSPFSAPKEDNPADNNNSFGSLLVGVNSFAKAIPGANLVKQTFDWQVSLIGRNMGSQIAQDKANAVMKIVGQVGGTVMAFAAGGPVGGLLAMAGVAMSYAREAEQASYDKSIEDINRRLLRERAGASFNRSREER